jgi:glucose-6-phosphate isomerase
MINLKERAGLDIFLKDNGELEFDSKVVYGSLQKRLFGEARDYFQQALKVSPIGLETLYHIYRGVRNEQDAPLFEKEKVTYDLTILFPGKIGREFNKTIGHFHNLILATKRTYPEVYQVIQGQAVFLIQQFDIKEKSVTKAFVVEARAGDVAAIPSQEGFLLGHNVANIGGDFLVVANLESRNVQNDYSLYKKNRGAGFYIMLNSQDSYQLEPNSHYKDISLSHYKNPAEIPSRLSIKLFQPIYKEFILNPGKFSFLNSTV